MLVLPASYFAWAAGADEEVIPFADTQAFNPERPRLPWDKTTEWLTPKEHFFHVAHYGYPEVDAASWKLEITGAVDRPRSFTLDDLKKRPRKEHTITLECSGNPPAGGLVGNARWAGTPLAPILKECGMRAEAVDVVFFAADKGTEKIRGGDYPQQFARSLDKADAMKDNVLVCWEMNGAPLTKNHGAPVRLMAPGWYGVAWVKWLERVEVHDRHYLSRFMGRDYVTIRGERRGEQTIWRETSVGRMNLKSVVGRVARRKDGVLNVTGAAWSPGPAIRSVELRIDDGPWTAVKLEKQSNPHAWTFWSHEWRDAKPGEHTLTARATDDRGKVQPSPDDDFIKLKKTYWEANQWAVRKLKI
jgi:DMSO/TMAO reductase YedYZ molybdopterin-dependent catalytic subunit